MAGIYKSTCLPPPSSLPPFLFVVCRPRQMNTNINSVPARFQSTVTSKPLIPLPALYLGDKFGATGRVPWSAWHQSDHPPGSTVLSATSTRHDAPVSITRTQTFSIRSDRPGDMRPPKSQAVKSKHRASQPDVPDSVSKSTERSGLIRRRTIHACEHCRDRKTKVCSVI